MAKVDNETLKRLSRTLVQVRRRSEFTQRQIAERMGTTQTSIARLESGALSPNLRTLQDYARANGFCLEIGFIREPGPNARTGCVIVLEDGV